MVVSGETTAGLTVLTSVCACSRLGRFDKMEYVCEGNVSCVDYYGVCVCVCLPLCFSIHLLRQYSVCMCVLFREVTQHGISQLSQPLLPLADGSYQSHRGVRVTLTLQNCLHRSCFEMVGWVCGHTHATDRIMDWVLTPLPVPALTLSNSLPLSLFSFLPAPNHITSCPGTSFNPTDSEPPMTQSLFCFDKAKCLLSY